MMKNQLLAIKEYNIDYTQDTISSILYYAIIRSLANDIIANKKARATKEELAELEEMAIHDKELRIAMINLKEDGRHGK